MAKRRFIIDIDAETNEKKLVISDIVMLLVFGGLITLVVVLFLTAMDNDKEKKEVFADLVVPVVEKNSESKFSVDLSAVKDGQYLIKVVNYKKDSDVNKEEMSYNLEIINENKVKIEVYKDNIKENLALSSNNLLVENNMLSSKERQEDFYKIIISDEKKLTDKDLLEIRITS